MTPRQLKAVFKWYQDVTVVEMAEARQALASVAPSYPGLTVSEIKGAAFDVQMLGTKCQFRSSFAFDLTRPEHLPVMALDVHKVGIDGKLFPQAFVRFDLKRDQLDRHCLEVEQGGTVVLGLAGEHMLMKLCLAILRQR